MKPSGGGPKVVPVPPPVSLFPGITAEAGGKGGGLEGHGYTLGKDMFDTLHDVTSGVDVNKIYQAIVDANKYQVAQGAAQINEAFGASGGANSSVKATAMGNYFNQNTADLRAQLEQLSFKNEALKMGGAEAIMNLATSFAPSAVVTQNAAGPSPFSQVSSAGEAAMMLFLMAA